MSIRIKDLVDSGELQASDYLIVDQPNHTGRAPLSDIGDLILTNNQVTSAGSTTARSLSDRFADVVNVKDFKSGGETDLSLWIRRAAVAAQGKLIVIPAGNYTALTTCELEDLSSVHIRADGANITVLNNVTFLRVGDSGVWSNIQTISPISNSSFWGSRRTLTVQDSSAFSINDIVKVVSDDKQRCTRPADGSADYRQGWMAIVEDVDTGNNQITIDRPCPWAMTTNPRIGKLRRRNVSWLGGTIGYELGHESDWRSTAMFFKSIPYLKVDVDIEHTYHSAISVKGCFESNINATGRDLLNNEFNNQFGYLVIDSSFYSNVHVISGRNRHAYTTGMGTTAVNNNNLTSYGGPYGSLVQGQSHGQSQAGFDTHHGSENITFTNTVSSGGTTNNLYVLRGVGHKLVNPMGYNGKNGIFIYSEPDVVNGETSAEIINPSITAYQYALHSTSNTNVTVSGGRLQSRKYGQVANLKGTTRLRDCISIEVGNSYDEVPALGGGGNDYSKSIKVIDCDVDARGCELLFDLDNVVTSDPYNAIELSGDTASSWVGGTIHTYNDNSLNAVFSSAGSATTQVNPKHIITSRLGQNSTHTMETGAGTAGWGFNGPVTWETEDGTGTSSLIERTFLTDDFSVDLYSRGDEFITLAMTVYSGHHKFGVMPLAVKVGQVISMTIVNSTAYTMTFQNGSAYNMNLHGSDVVLNTGDTLRLAALTDRTWVKI